MKARTSVLAALVAAVLAGCGGHGSEGSPTSAPTIRSQPQSTSAAVGDSVTFSVSARSSGSGETTYQWYRNTTPITGATSATYTIASVTSSDYATYTVRVTNDFGTTTSAAATLTAPDTGAPRITSQPTNASVTAGTDATFTVVATGDDLEYQWFKDGVAIDGATSATLTVSSVGSEDVGSYYVRITNPNGNVTSASATLSLQSSTAPVVTTPPASQTKNEGATLTLTVAASGKSPLSYQWTKDGADIAGQTSSTLRITPVQRSTAGVYRVRVTNDLGSTTSDPANVTVHFKPEIQIQPSSGTLDQGQQVTLTVGAVGTVEPDGTVTASDLTYKWFKDGSTAVLSTTSTLTIFNLRATDAGRYYVVVSNSAGSTQSAYATLTVNTAPSVDLPATTIATFGQSLTLTPTVTGTTPLTYKWLKDGVDTGITTATYTIGTVAVSDAATYTVQVTNSLGTASDATVVHVQPGITTQPTNRTVSAGGNATFTVAGGGEATLVYQWYKNGAAISDGATGSGGAYSGATTATLTITGAQSGDAGTYSVRITNAYGEAVSNDVTLTVS